MKELNNAEMFDVNGGSVSIKTAGLITGIVGGIITFIIGIVDGYLNPNKCK